MNEHVMLAQACPHPSQTRRQLVCVQGLGFVGSAMAIAIANARGPGGPFYDVVGVDLPTEAGRHRVASIAEGRLPFAGADKMLGHALAEAHAAGNLTATCNPEIFKEANVVVVDINLDIDWSAPQPIVHFDALQRAVDDLGQRLRPGSLIIVETTVPPGTCERVLAPRLAASLRTRGLPDSAILLAHSYERVMPGADYYSSIVNYWRVYAGTTSEAADACEYFLSNVINVAEYPLTRLASPTASETAKVLENSFRAVNIAFMEEWGRFAEAVGIDLFDIVEAVRKRPTHANIRQPGFGVGGYCLTKDPLFGVVAARAIFSRPDLAFPFSSEAVRTNAAMPLLALAKVRERLGGSLKGSRILLLGVSYREDVGDTRYSPAQVFVEAAEREGAEVTTHDPLVTYWPELDRPVESELPPAKMFDAVVFTQAAPSYRAIELGEWLRGSAAEVIDANNVLTREQRRSVSATGCSCTSIGRG
ncbi:nucleotide sugar dehydrogenase [Methylobacterium nigriterrae]|uniref:nucleotide sugar dehydrogenase n=1 Tax=Methylobacterium nigriterrae TaxID=3127512 RepID=UPI0030137D5E